MENCSGQHRYHVAETGVIETEGKVIVVLVCIQCGEGKLHEFKVAGKVQLLEHNQKG